MATIFDQIKTGAIPRKAARNFLKKQNAKYGNNFVPHEGKHPNNSFVKAMRNKDFLVQIFDEDHAIRLSITKAELNKDCTRWRDGITWDEIQGIKNQLGYQDKCAVELYPPEEEVVNVANIRHIFILKELPEFMWKKK